MSTSINFLKILRKMFTKKEKSSEIFQIVGNLEKLFSVRVVELGSLFKLLSLLQPCRGAIVKIVT